jgi:azurin
MMSRQPPAQEEMMTMRLIRQVLASAALIGAAVVLPTAANAANAADKVCKLAISGNDLMQYDKTELVVAADCTSVELTLTHTGKLPKEAMGHNWVLVNTPDISAVASSGLTAGAGNSYVDAKDKKVLAHTKLVGGGEKDTITFPTAILKKGGAYSYECTMPGHNSVMHGVLKFG